MAEIELTILKYDTLFTKRNSDLKKHLWFSFPNDLLLHPDFFNITSDELKWFIWCVCISSKMMSPTIKLQIDHSAHQLKLKPEALFSMVKKLEGKQIDVARGLNTAAPRLDHVPYITEHNKTKQNTILSISNEIDVTDSAISKKVRPSFHAKIEKLYLDLYPRHEGKSKGISKLLREIKTEVDLQDLEKAIVNYRSKHGSKETQYIKLFSSFASEWRDWVDVKDSLEELIKNMDWGDK